MSTQDQQPADDHIMVIGPDGQPVAVPADAVQDDEDRDDRANGSPVWSSSPRR